MLLDSSRSENTASFVRNLHHPTIGLVEVEESTGGLYTEVVFACTQSVSLIYCLRTAMSQSSWIEETGIHLYNIGARSSVD